MPLGWLWRKNGLLWSAEDSLSSEADLESILMKNRSTSNVDRLTRLVAQLDGRVSAAVLTQTVKIEDRMHSRNESLPIVIALGRFRSTHGEFPNSLSELTSDLLPELPTDPISGQSYGYESNGKTLLLYSVSHDGIDQGGRIYKDQSDGPYDELTIAEYPRPSW